LLALKGVGGRVERRRKAARRGASGSKPRALKPSGERTRGEARRAGEERRRARGTGGARRTTDDGRRTTDDGRRTTDGLACVERAFRFARDVPNDRVFTIPFPSHARHRSSYFIAMRSMLHESFVGWHSASSAVEGRNRRSSFHMYPRGVAMGSGSARWPFPFSGLGSGFALIVETRDGPRALPRRRSGGGGAARS
jgi:hypothetical protein